MEYLAHSAEGDIPAQTYVEHIYNVIAASRQYASQAASYSKNEGEELVAAVSSAAPIHDIGKLIEKNQIALRQGGSEHLPVHHADAAVAFLHRFGSSAYTAKMIAGCHHKGLPDLYKESKKRKSGNEFRDSEETRRKTDEELDTIIEKHISSSLPFVPNGPCTEEHSAMFYRMCLSCLADADQIDTARHRGMFPERESLADLKAEERLFALNQYVQGLKNQTERSLLRSEMYDECRDFPVSENIAACDSPVGSGKTTAVMAHLLNQAITRKARRVFVVLPYTNIIKQSVEEYRKALVLPGENPEEVVAEIHHLADFENDDIRHLSTQWRAPIIVTTAVAFFETLASNKPSTLRKLHELPGSVIFVDEAHAAMPLNLLPVTWKWMNILAEEWHCYWVLASGSLVNFWEIEEISKKRRNVPYIVPKKVRDKLNDFEQRRVEYLNEDNPLSISELTEKVLNTPGPRLIIMNTVRNAAIIANAMVERVGRGKVEHLSTALNAVDRDATVDRVKQRLANKYDNDWTLVATSCVEAGVNFSFQSGFREKASILSLLQASGRVSRGGEYPNAVMWSFSMRKDENSLTENPSLEISISVLNSIIRSGKQISQSLCTEAIEKELDRTPQSGELEEQESNCFFEKVKDQYHIIGKDTVLLIPDKELADGIERGGCDWKQIQRMAVSVRTSKARSSQLKEIIQGEGIYRWDLGYDAFLGIMKGEIDRLRAGKEVLIL